MFLIKILFANLTSSFMILNKLVDNGIKKITSKRFELGFS